MKDKAIILIHGILGKPEQFAPLLPLIPEDYEVKNITLVGHGGTPLDFGRYPMSEWKKEVHKELEELCENYRHVYVVGHSLGTLFAIQESTKLPIKKLFLLNVPLGVIITPKLFKLCWQVFWNDVDKRDPFVMAAMNSYGISNDKNLLHYVKWILRYIELFKEIIYTKKNIKKLHTPTIAFVSLQDEMAAPRSAKVLHENTDAKVVLLRESGHFYYSPRDIKKIKSIFSRYFICNEI